jgi:hypothetical protein
MNAIKLVEGVPYSRFRVEFRDTTGKRHRLTHWSPGHPWLVEEIRRLLSDCYDVAPAARVIVRSTT